MQFLGFIIDSRSMTISLTRDKIQKTVQEARNLLQRQQVSARELAHMVGIFSSAIPAILPAPLNYRELQSLKHNALKIRGYSSPVEMTDQARDDLLWWVSTSRT
jgi:hypothetical protein